MIYGANCLVGIGVNMNTCSSISLFEQQLSKKISASTCARSCFFVACSSSENPLCACNIIRDVDISYSLQQSIQNAQHILEDSTSSKTVLHQSHKPYFYNQDKAEQPRIFWNFSSIDCESSFKDIDIVDIRRLASASKNYPNIFVTVDASMITFIGTNPLKMGAQIVYEKLPIESDCHQSIWLIMLMRSRARRHAIALNDDDYQDFVNKIFTYKNRCACLDESTLLKINNWLETLKKHIVMRNDFASSLATYLRCHPLVKRCNYPGLTEHAAHNIAASVLMHGYGPIIRVLLHDECQDLDRIKRKFTRSCHELNNSVTTQINTFSFSTS